MVQKLTEKAISKTKIMCEGGLESITDNFIGSIWASKMYRWNTSILNIVVSIDKKTKELILFIEGTKRHTHFANLHKFYCALVGPRNNKVAGILVLAKNKVYECVRTSGSVDERFTKWKITEKDYHGEANQWLKRTGI